MIYKQEKLAPLIMVGGTDGSGKGLAVDTLGELCERESLKLFDLREHEKEHPYLPGFQNLKDDGYDVAIMAEPTHSETGYSIRQLLKANHTARGIAEGFSFDRYNLDMRLTIPCRQNNIAVIKERGVESSFVYQYLLARYQDEQLSFEEIRELEGNKLAFEQYPPSHIIICHCPVDISIKRLASRDKKDDAIYEKHKDFMQGVLERYQSNEVKELFESQGIKVLYLDTDTGSPEETKETIRKDIWPLIKEHMYKTGYRHKLDF